MAGSENPDKEEAEWNKHHTPPKTKLTPNQEKEALKRLGTLAQDVLDKGNKGKGRG